MSSMLPVSRMPRAGRTTIAAVVVCVAAIGIGGLGQVQHVPAPPESDTGVPLTKQIGRFEAEVADLHDPHAAAIGADGAIYVVDQSLPGVRVIDSRGKTIRSWGVRGSSRGEFLAPAGIAVEPGNGLVFVTDSVNHRVQVFTADGQFRRSWGGYGSGPDHLSHPLGIWADGRLVYVADSGNHRVQVFDHNGRVVRSIGDSAADGPVLINPVDVAANGAGEVFVADRSAQRISRFAPDGVLSQSWGERGVFPGLFNFPSGIACHGGLVFVADSANHRVQVFNEAGEWQYQWGRHVTKPHEGGGRLHYPCDVFVSPDGREAVVAESFENRLQIFSLRRSPQDDDTREAMLQADAETISHYGEYLDAYGDLLAIAEPESDSVLLFAFGKDEPLQISRAGAFGDGPGQFRGVRDVALSSDATQLDVLDSVNRRLHRFALSWDTRAEVRQIPRLAQLMATVDLASWCSRPTAMAQDGAGNTYILDTATLRVVVIDAELRFVRSWGGRGERGGEFLAPTDIALNPAGDIVYVVDRYQARVHACDVEGRPLFFIGQYGRGSGELLEPFGIAVDRDGNVFVTDTAMNRVTKFSPRGQMLLKWGAEGIGRGQFFRPRGVAVDSRGRVVVIDWGNHRGQVFKLTGEYLEVFGGYQYALPARQPLR